VLQICAADDLRSIFSAARAHSRLHQAAVAALSSITTSLSQQKQLNDVLLYVEKYSRYVDSISIEGRWKAILHQLPPSLQLSSLQLETVRLQLLAGNGFQGVLGAAAAVAALKQLRLTNCLVLDDQQGLAAALSPLSSVLEHLSISTLRFKGDRQVVFPTAVLRQLQQLTYLELARIRAQGPDEASPALQPLEALTRLVDLRLISLESRHGRRTKVSDSMLSGMQQLTRLELCAVDPEPGVLAGKTMLQHLVLQSPRPSGDVAVSMAQLLSHMQHLQHLTHLDLQGGLQAYDTEWGNPADDGSDTYQERVNPPAAAYAALTASSKLQYLDITNCHLPVGVWQHMFPANKQLPHLQYLGIAGVMRPSGVAASAPDGIISCCPDLRVLDMQRLRHSAKLLGPLQGLRGLHTLRLAPSTAAGLPAQLALVGAGSAEGFEAVCQLTGLKELTMRVTYTHGTREQLVRPLLQLQQLTVLGLAGRREHISEKRINLTEVSPTSVSQFLAVYTNFLRCCCFYSMPVEPTLLSPACNL
jgi:hypothetical protein